MVWVEVWVWMYVDSLDGGVHMDADSLQDGGFVVMDGLDMGCVRTRTA